MERRGDRVGRRCVRAPTPRGIGASPRSSAPPRELGPPRSAPPRERHGSGSRPPTAEYNDAAAEKAPGHTNHACQMLSAPHSNPGDGHAEASEYATRVPRRTRPVRATRRPHGHAGCRKLSRRRCLEAKESATSAHYRTIQHRRQALARSSSWLRKRVCVDGYAAHDDVFDLRPVEWAGTRACGGRAEGRRRRPATTAFSTPAPAPYQRNTH